MDETTAIPAGALRDGFAGQRMFVLPRSTVTGALGRPVTSSLVVTDAGVFPRAAHHGRDRPRGADEHVLLVCTSGSGWCESEHGRRAVGRGDAVVLPARRPHRYAAAENDPWTLWWVHVTGSDAGALVAAAGAAAGGPVSHLRDAGAVASLISQAIDGLDSGTTGGLIRSTGAVWHALSLVIATGRRARGDSPSPVERAVEHLRATTPGRTSTRSLAAMVGLSPSQLAALFREQVGMPPLRYQTALRMALARELLDSTADAVGVVAARCGYDDPLYFSRQFGRTHGMSPTVYRARTTAV